MKTLAEMAAENPDDFRNKTRELTAEEQRLIQSKRAADQEKMDQYDPHEGLFKVNLKTAQHNNESGLSVEVGCYVAIDQMGVIIAVSEMPDPSVDQLKEMIEQFCDEMDEEPDDFEIAVVVE